MKVDNPLRRAVLETIVKTSLFGLASFSLGGCESLSIDRNWARGAPIRPCIGTGGQQGVD